MTVTTFKKIVYMQLQANDVQLQEPDFLSAQHEPGRRGVMRERDNVLLSEREEGDGEGAGFEEMEIQIARRIGKD